MKVFFNFFPTPINDFILDEQALSVSLLDDLSCLTRTEGDWVEYFQIDGNEDGIKGIARALIALGFQRGKAVWDLLSKRVFSTLLINPVTYGPRITGANGLVRSGHVKNIFVEDFGAYVSNVLEGCCSESIRLSPKERVFRFYDFSSLCNCFSTDVVSRTNQVSWSVALPMWLMRSPMSESELNIIIANGIRPLKFTEDSMVRALKHAYLDGVSFYLCIADKTPTSRVHLLNQRTVLRMQNNLGNDAFLWGENGWVAECTLEQYAIPIVSFKTRGAHTAFGSIIFTCIPTVISKNGAVIDYA